MSTVAQRVQLGPFFDQGVICPAALLYHYEPGSSSLKNIWSDQSMATPLPQPFISDANGVFNFFADGYYKIIVKKSNGDTLYTLDNWRWVDPGQTDLSIGTPLPTASSMLVGDSTWAHWTGSVDVQAMSGSALFYWAVADGNFSLIASSVMILPEARNRRVLAGDTMLFLNESAGVWRLAAHMQKEGGWTGRQGAVATAASTLAVPTDGDFIEVSGGTDITAVGVASAGYRFRALFSGTGLNIVHNAISMVSPWGVSYRTVQNELIEFLSLGSGNWIFYSLNGPKAQTGQVVSWHSATTPKGCLALDGSTFSSVTYPGLFAVLGTTTLPDDRGRFELMVDGAANRVTSASVGGANADTLGGTGGAQIHTLVLSEVPSKTVSYTAVRNVAGGVCASGGDKGEQTNNLNVGGSDGAHNNMPNWIARYRYIRY